MQEFEKFVGQLSDFVWGPPLLILLLGTHVFLTFRLRFIQRYLGKAIKLSVQRSHEGQGDVSQFGALTTALAATIGTGNIVGVATAIAAGGPGAVLWMWLPGVLMAVLTAFVILGGIKSIAKVCEFLVPFMAIFYVGGCIILLIVNASGIPATIELIVQSAFTGHAMIGGFAGATMKEAIRYGVARGLFSNESGLGRAPIVAAAAQPKIPCARRSFLPQQHSGTRLLYAR